MKFIKFSIILLVVLVAVLSRKSSHSKSHSRSRISDTSFKSETTCSNVSECSSVCSKIRIETKDVSCDDAECNTGFCYCNPNKSKASTVAKEDKCVYVDSKAKDSGNFLANFSKKFASLGIKNKRRRRY